jgi:NAD(P)-dependent dehydrogenase (short-subunit alcohol dehydrogenase family)
MPISTNNPSNLRAYIITGPTSGFGRATALEVARHGTVVLVGRDREKLGKMSRAREPVKPLTFGEPSSGPVPGSRKPK